MKISNLKNSMPRTGIMIFILFFGLSVLEAVRSREWIAVGYWALIAAVFLLLDNGTKNKGPERVGYK